MALGGGSALNIDGSLHCSKASLRVEGHPSIQATGVAFKGTINGKILSHSVVDDIFVKLCHGDFELADDAVALRTGKRDLDGDKIRIGMMIHAECGDTEATAVDGWIN
jgi:predicted NodU family carbamoyl transferase